MKVSKLAKKINNEGSITPENMHKTIKETLEFCKNTTFASSLVIELKKKNHPHIQIQPKNLNLLQNQKMVLVTKVRK